MTASADPDPRKIQILDGPPGAALAYSFSADVVSDDQGSEVEGRLYIDYGKPNLGGAPYNQLGDIPTKLTAGTMADAKPRRMEIKGTLAYPLEPGCHTATLMVSHGFTQKNCPTCLDDSSQISWPLFRCNSLEAPCKPDFSDSACTDVAPGCPNANDLESSVQCGASP